MKKHLFSLGFHLDETAPQGVNRLELFDGKIAPDGCPLNRTFWASITLSPDGEKTEYGVILFFGPYLEVTLKRKFTGEMTPEGISRFLDKLCPIQADIVKVFPCNPHPHRNA